MKEVRAIREGITVASRALRHFARLALLAPLALSSPARAANTESFGFWNQNLAQGSFAFVDPDLKRFQWWAEGQARVFDQLDHVGQGLARAAVGYRLVDAAPFNMTFWGGYTWNPSRLEGKKEVDEHDLFPALTYSFTSTQGVLSGRSMADFRVTDTGARTGYRYRQQIRYMRPFDFEPCLSLIAWDEVFFNLNNTDWGQKTGIDQNRAFVGAGWNFTPNFRVETGYFNWFLNTHNAGSGTDTSRHLIAVNLTANF